MHAYLFTWFGRPRWKCCVSRCVQLDCVEVRVQGQWRPACAGCLLRSCLEPAGGYDDSFLAGDCKEPVSEGGVRSQCALLWGWLEYVRSACQVGPLPNSNWRQLWSVWKAEMCRSSHRFHLVCAHSAHQLCACARMPEFAAELLVAQVATCKSSNSYTTTCSSRPLDSMAFYEPGSAARLVYLSLLDPVKGVLI
jgi:hypothetical protein